MNKNIVRIFAAIFFIAVTSFTLNQFAGLILPLLKINYDLRFELGVVTGQLLFQLPFISGATLNEKANYYYQMLQVSFIGSVLLWPLLLVNRIHLLSHLADLVSFFGIVIFMFFEHKRRVRALSLPGYISYTWILYRFLILLFIV
ncbi:MAG: hypothetical protein ACJ77K_13075 [Bacteroidia bacterium]